MKKVLFIAEPVTVTHVTRPLVLAQALDPNQYEVHFACDERSKNLFKGSEFTYHPLYSIPSATFLKRVEQSRILYTYEELKRYVEDERRLISKIKPDLVVSDLRFSMAVSIPLEKVLHACVNSAYWSPLYNHDDIPVPEGPLVTLLGIRVGKIIFNAFGPLFIKLHSKALNRLRKENGLQPLAFFDAYVFGNYSLYCDLPSYVPIQNAPSHHIYLGPILWSYDETLPEWWHEPDEDTPSIFITMGSSGKISLLSLLVDSLSDYPGKVFIATTGRIDLGQTPPHIRVGGCLPAQAFGRRAGLVICNGGSPVSYVALSEGKPVLGIPSNIDQHMMMDNVVKRGAGLMLRSDQITKESAKKTILELIHNPKYRQEAMQYSSELKLYNAQERFREFVRKVVS
jgi:UDP:flavonoid glycosyltransferase YjiC (YdhE family)